ncbi:hypothetical protein M011DRAFT_467765 [Sporormia fimetaria CBS 119925]|uniref:ABM domain-containing protein n=1 Tax=Sporormia fimetaria CBS 119925 TaxID=1340428 RepID=A0A6A6VAW2_9PLEO|nr:hypothetical protein M011DRAFT_467765 [Sporormia fimetaria CBS 119925]
MEGNASSLGAYIKASVSSFLHLSYNTNFPVILCYFPTPTFLMAVTELALLRLIPPTTAREPELRAKLKAAKEAMEKYTGRRFYFLQQIQDPDIVYVLGEWESVAQHMQGWIPSVENRAVLEMLKDDLTVDWLHHFDVPHMLLPISDRDLGRVYSIVLHRRDRAGREQTERFPSLKQEFVEPQEAEHGIETGHGWAVDFEDEKEVQLLICAWKATPEGVHEPLKYCSRYFEDVEVDEKHARIMDL